MQNLSVSTVLTTLGFFAVNTAAVYADTLNSSSVSSASDDSNTAISVFYVAIGFVIGAGALTACGVGVFLCMKLCHSSALEKNPEDPHKDNAAYHNGSFY